MGSMGATGRREQAFTSSMCRAVAVDSYTGNLQSGGQKSKKEVTTHDDIHLHAARTRRC